MRCPRAVLAAVAAGLVLAGCQSDPEPRIADPTTKSTSTPTEPTTPPTSESPTVDPARETAEDFIRRFQAEGTRAQNTGDVSTFESMSESCGSCDDLVEGVRAIYAEGCSLEVGEARVRSLERVGRSGPVQIFEYDLRSPPGSLRNPDGSIKESFTGGSERFQINVRRGESGWFVTELTQLS